MEMITRATRRRLVRLFAILSAAILLARGGPERPAVHAQDNPIVTENALPGSPQNEWDIQGSGDPTLQGFATDISVNKGSIISFKIKTTAPGYVIDIYRLGYYQGFGARKIATVTPTAAQVTAAQNQPACLTDPASGLIDCGNWAVAGSWNTGNTTSGIFIAKLSRSDNLDASSHIYFIVRDDSRTADILMQTSDTTWQAYNMYGGNSLYCNGPLSNAAGRYNCPSRSGKVSYNRPFDTRAHDATSFLFNAEYPMVRFLEANGYDVKYWTGVDTDRFGADPSIGLTSVHRPRAFFSVGHDEYWSGPQRTHVESARNAGVNLAFFSGNEMFWRTRYESSIDASNTSYRTLVSFKETFGNGSRVDPNPANPWTGTWRDPRFPAVGGNNPENGLIGQLWMVNCCSDRIHVPPSMANLRFWRNTAVASLPAGDPGYRTSVETLGYEWDEVIDNGFLPSGLVRMSLTTLIVPERVLDFGINIGVGAATHSLTMYRHNSGAIVFGAGTVQWAWGLDAAHDRTQVPADHAMQQATINLLADMGAQPRTLQVGANPNRPLLTASMSSDIFAPTSTIASPAGGSSVESGSRVAISGTATEVGGGTVAGVEISVDNGATWRSANLLPSGVWTYEWTPGSPGTATIKSRAFDDSGNVEGVGPGTTVTIGVGTCPCTSLWRPTVIPTVVSAADGNAVELGTKFYSDIDGFVTGVRFYKSTGNTGTHAGNLWSLSGTRLASVIFSNETASGWQQAMFSTPVAVTANTTYVISYHTNVGSYSADGGYFATAPVDSPPLHAPTGAAAGGNGVFVYGESQFPTGTFNATNYWVDVVFAPTLDDSTPPVISHIKSKIIDSARITISWSTDEESTSKIQYSTDPDILSSSTTLPPGTQAVEAGSFVTQHSISLSGLTPNTTYYYRVISVDRSGNAANVAAPSVTVPGPTLRDTAAVDFAAGQSSGTYVSETTDGEVILAPVAGTEFSGTALSPGWRDVPYAAGGAAFLGNGAVLVDGSRLGTCVDVGNGICQEQWTMTPGHRLEFMGIFTGDAFQHSGLAQDFGSASQPWAIFSTLGGGILTARTNTGAGSVETFLGTGFLGFMHKYTIDWHDTSVVYSIDGTVVATHNVTVAGPMRPIAASDFSVFGGNVVIDWMRMSPYAATGAFESRVFDANTIVDWRSMQWKAKAPAGTSVAMSIRTGATPDPSDGTWTAWELVAAPGPLAVSSRYIQYRAVLSTTDPSVTPEVEDVIVSTGQAPIAVNDAVVVPENGTITFPASGADSLTANDTDPDNDPLEVVAVGLASHGATLLNFDGSVRYTPATNYNGPDSFVYTVSDGLLTSTAVVSIDVRFGNIPPVANHDFYSTNEEVTLIVPAASGILKNDTDADHDPLTAVLVTLPAHGMLALNSIGSFTYTPHPNYAGPDVFTYRASDGQLTSDPATVQIQVQQVNDAPIAEPDSYTALVNQALDISAPGVLANDHDVEVEDTAPLHAQLVTGPANGTVTLNADGSFHYQPNAEFLGLDQFTYAAVDHFGAVGSPAAVSITVALKAVSQAVNGGGTVATGSDVTPGSPLVSGVTSPAAATVRISQGVIAGSQPPSGYTFLNQQVNILVLNPDGSELTATFANPIRLAFTIDGTLLLPGENGNSVQIFRNGVLIPNCLGQTSIPAANFDPCVTARETSNQDVRLTVISSHASRWNMGLSNEAIGTAPVAQNDGVYSVDFQTPLVIPASGVVGNDYGRNGLTAILSAGSVVGGSVDLSASGAFTFTPGPTACGPASFKYRANDGTLDSNEATVSISIDCKPRAGNDAVTIAEDSGTTTITVLSNDTDPDPGQVLTVTSVGSAAHGVTSILGGGLAVNYAPEANFYGTDSFTYTIADGRGGTDTATVTATVAEVNDAPSFTKGTNPSVNEDAGLQTAAGWATNLNAGPANESGQLLDFILSNDNPALFAGQPAIAANGTLTYTPAADANGSATVTVSIHDDGGVLNAGVDTSTAQSFTITVNAVNDAPSFVKGADQSANEDGGAQSVANWATAMSAGPADEAGQALNFLVSNDNNALFAAQPAIAGDGTLTYTPSANVNGTAVVSVRLHDAGGTSNGGVDTSAAQTFTISVGAVNDAPSFTKGADQAVLEDAGTRAVANWATNFSPGPADESGQQVLAYVVLSNSNAALFSVAPAVANDGTLSFTPATNASGVATVTVAVRDNGGVANGGADTSAPQSFTITVTAVNDAPAFTKGANPIVTEDSGSQTMPGWATAMSAGPSDESGQALTFQVTGSSNPLLFAAAPAVSANGTLTFTPAPNASGSAMITLVLSDDGGTANGGVNTSAAQTFTIAISDVNDAPAFAKGADQALYGNPGAQTVNNWATGISAGPANEAGQALMFTTTNNNTALFAVQPSVSSNGTLTYTPATDVIGTAIVTVVLKDNGGVANDGIDTSAPQTFQVTVNKSPTVTSLASSNNPSLAGAPITLTAAVVGTAPNVGVPGGTVTFKDGTATLGTVTLAGGVATFTTSTLAVGSRSLTAVYTPVGNFVASTSPALTQVISASATMNVRFEVHAILDGTKNPKVRDQAVPGAEVRVYTKRDQCTNGIIVSGKPKMWGIIFDGSDGPGGATSGCDPVSYGSYIAQGITDATGRVDIIVPPTTNDPNTDYVVIARTTTFDYIKTTITPDPLYSEKTISTIAAGASKDVRLHQIATFAGKLMPGKDLEEFGSYLGIVQPDFVDWTDDKEAYPVVLVAEGAWGISTNLTPPEGFVVEENGLSASVADGTGAIQFTMNDIGSDWTGTTVNHTITHNGEIRLRSDVIPMFNRKFSKAFKDTAKMMLGEPSVTIDVLNNDRMGTESEWLSLNYFTQPNYGRVSYSADGMSLVYTPDPGWSGYTTFVYNLQDDRGIVSSADVWVYVLPQPTVSTKTLVNVTEGNSGAVTGTATITLSNESTHPITVNYTTVDDTATAGSDYVAASGSVTIPPDALQATVPLQINGDTLAEPNEQFIFRISSPTNATLGDITDEIVKILDDDPPVVSAQDLTVAEGNVATKVVNVVVKLSQSDTRQVTVNYATVDGTATAGNDYVAASGTLTFAPGAVSKTIPITIMGDTVGEPAEQFYVDLSAPVVAIMGQARATVSITNDDAVTTTTTTAAQFAEGTADAGLSIVQNNGGELMLTPAINADFSGPGLAAGWVSSVLEGGGATVGGDILVVNAATVMGPTGSGTPRALDVVATLTAANQVIGLGAGSMASPLAAFVVKADGLLYIRTIAPTSTGAIVTKETAVAGSWLGAAHTFHIDWNAANAAYKIDGTAVGTHTGVAWGSLAVAPMFMDGTAGDGAVTVDWTRLTPHAASGTYTKVFDAGAVSAWTKLVTGATVPAGTTLAVSYRTGNTPTPDASWSAPTTLAGTGGTLVGSGQYLQLTLQFTTTNALKTPVVNDLTLTYKPQ